MNNLKSLSWTQKIADDKRRDEISLIHVAYAKLGMTNADHKALLHALYGVDSSVKLNFRQRRQYIDHLRKLGFKPVRPKPKVKSKIDRSLDTCPEMRKARAIWLMLHAIGVVHNPSESALVAWGKRMGKVDALQWQQRPDILIEGLKKWAMRHLPAWVNQRLDEKLKKIPISELSNPFSENKLVRYALSLREAKAKGLKLFDYYWPIWEILQLPEDA